MRVAFITHKHHENAYKIPHNLKDASPYISHCRDNSTSLTVWVLSILNVHVSYC